MRDASTVIRCMWVKLYRLLITGSWAAVGSLLSAYLIVAINHTMTITFWVYTFTINIALVISQTSMKVMISPSLKIATLKIWISKNTCGVGQCKACDMLSKKDCVFDSGGKKHKTAKGKCNSRNLIYHARCKHCDKVYVGKTTQALNNRISGHRGKFVECLLNSGHQPHDDDHLLGLHLYHKHSLGHRSDFNESYDFTILENCNPKNLDLYFKTCF